jgi:hypothetical protein
MPWSGCNWLHFFSDFFHLAISILDAPDRLLPDTLLGTNRRVAPRPLLRTKIAELARRARYGFINLVGTTGIASRRM